MTSQTSAPKRFLALLLLLATVFSLESLADKDFPLSLDEYLNGKTAWLVELKHLPTLREFYKNRKSLPIWIGLKDGEPVEINHEGRWFLLTIAGADAEGLSPSWYHYRGVLALFDKLSHGAGERTLEKAIALELFLTDAYLSYASDLIRGHLSPSALDPDWNNLQSPPESEGVLALTALNRGAENGEMVEALAALSPTHPEYAPLKEALQSYLRIEQLGGWTEIPEGSALRLNSKSPRIGLVRRRLSVESSPSHKNIFDKKLVRALKEFQWSHGLKPDGILAENTLNALNVPIGERISQLRVNLERLRWLPRQMDGPHILVDIAKFQLQLKQGERTILQMPIIVGNLDWKTPMFVSSITHLIVWPSWTIPNSIAARELADKAEWDLSYLASHHIQATQFIDGKSESVPADIIQWDQVRSEKSPYLFVQSPGPANPMGEVKFIFENKYAVYLHGTPQSSLFKNNSRTFSHGCIRVQKPVELAEQILRIAREHSERVLASASQQASEDKEKLKSLIQSEKTSEIRLEKAIPIYLVYRTAWTDSKGRLSFRPDVYGWDQVVAQALIDKPGDRPADRLVDKQPLKE